MPAPVDISTSVSALDLDSEKQYPAVTSAPKDGLVHQKQTEDERAAFLATFTLEEEKKILRKIDYHFLLLLGLMHMTKSIDTASAASVKVLQVGQPSNILKELHMTADQYNWVQTFYYFGYIFFEAPMVATMKKMLPHRYYARILVSWGTILACHAALKGKEGFYTARFFMGLMEAGLLPGHFAQLVSWYRTEDMHKPVMWYTCLQNCSGIIGSLLVYGVSYLDGRCGMSAWRWVFLIEGVATIAFGIVVYFLWPDYPKSKTSARWLSEREQDFIEARLSENAPRTAEPAFSWQEVRQSLTDPMTWLFTGCQGFVNLGGFGLTWYTPTIVTDLGFAKLPRNQLLIIPPSAAAVLACIFAGWFMKKGYITRPLFAMLDLSCMVVCFILFFTISSRGGIYAACIIATAFYWMYFPIFYPWRTANLRGATRTAVSIGISNGLAQCGGAIGPQLFRSKWKHNRYRNSFAICASFVITAWFVNAYTWWVTRNVECDVQRIRHRRKEAAKEGRVLNDDDIKVFEERQFYQGLHRKTDG
ncbi:hypothetical protein A1O3_06612 [Capronia epimyces CBS 606.96]|uniref:Major facilitator superfamily (MFS) profile domain-containing protein n=1 Tax=Capronia epimyces CBS 606.96 TaxID=1182542 RepID=W9XQH4_9EURO|nr:uncharacterized protein A1O3_06612 [Capronia epimyces CBS 606.96]EXJ82797.1 hypothetical protein A1O3_06612 [Capronia epimyces CBS 606.96]